MMYTMFNHHPWITVNGDSAMKNMETPEGKQRYGMGILSPWTLDETLIPCGEVGILGPQALRHFQSGSGLVTSHVLFEEHSARESWSQPDHLSGLPYFLSARSVWTPDRCIVARLSRCFMLRWQDCTAP